METEANRILVIPDVHGRSFWKKAVEETPCEKIVFLGDYMDPYAREGIRDEDALGVFFDVLNVKKMQEQKVVLTKSFCCWVIMICITFRNIFVTWHVEHGTTMICLILFRGSFASIRIGFVWHIRRRWVKCVICLRMQG